MQGDIFYVKDKFVEEIKRPRDFFQAERFYMKITGELNWFEKIISHAPSIGSYYENLLRNSCREIFPCTNKVATGFILDLEEGKTGKQIDILVYDDSQHSIIYRNGEFVVVQPEQVVACAEVKKRLTKQHLKNLIAKTLFSQMGYSRNGKRLFKYRIFSFADCGRISSFAKDVVELINEEVGLNFQNKIFDVNLTLPELYFLDGSKYVYTELIKDGDHCKVSVKVIDTDCRYGSLGAFLDVMMREAPHYNTSYLHPSVVFVPEEMYVCSNPVYLNSEYKIKDIAGKYSDFDSESDLIEKSVGGDPISIFVPILKDLDSYSNVRDLVGGKNVYVKSLDEKGAIRMAFFNESSRNPRSMF